MCQFRNLKKKCGPNDATPVDIYVIVVEDVTTLPAPTTTLPGGPFNTITTAPTLVATKKFQVLQGARKVSKFTDDTEGELDGNVNRSQKLVTLYPEADPEAAYNMSISLGARVLVGWKNGSGNQILWGTLENPVEVTKCNFDSSKGGWDIEFMRLAGPKEVPPFFTGTFEV